MAGQLDVDFVRTDVTDAAPVAAAVQPGQQIVQLAHAGGTDWQSVERYMVGGARIVAKSARQRRAAHLDFVSSLAALILGDASEIVDDHGLLDPLPEARAAYARGSVESERLLHAVHVAEILPVTAVSPGLVVGAGTSIFHSGGWEFNRETHCLGWTAGGNPLPFLLALDVAAAIAALLTSLNLGWTANNLVGDVRPSAISYVLACGGTGRPLWYHPRSPRTIAAVNAAKWLTRRLGGRSARRISLHDLSSRGLVARFVTDAVKARLDWRPVSDPVHSCPRLPPMPSDHAIGRRRLLHVFSTFAVGGQQTGWRGSSIGLDRPSIIG